MNHMTGPWSAFARLEDSEKRLNERSRLEGDLSEGARAAEQAHRSQRGGGEGSVPKSERSEPLHLGGSKPGPRPWALGCE